MRRVCCTASDPVIPRIAEQDPQEKCLNSAECLIQKGKFLEAEKILISNLEGMNSLNQLNESDSIFKAKLCHLLAYALNLQGKYLDTIGPANQGLKTLENLRLNLPDLVLKIKLYILITGALNNKERYSEALVNANEGLALIRGLGNHLTDRTLEPELIFNLVVALINRKKFSAAMTEAKKGLEILSNMGFLQNPKLLSLKMSLQLRLNEAIGRQEEELPQRFLVKRSKSI